VNAAPEQLEVGYRRCRELARRYGVTYYWSTQLLPRDRRRHVYALYAFCRLADDVVDDLSDAPTRVRANALACLGDDLAATLAVGRSDHPVLAALADTVQRFDIPVECFSRFLRSMEMDLTVTTYETWGDLCGYMDGSAAVIGEMMLPILEPRDSSAREPARDLGLAFQLTNFLRDVGEDLDRGRVYLPQEDLDRFGADPRRHTVDDEWRELMRFEIGRARELYASARHGIELLPASSARCVRAAHALYGRILTVIERQDYDVFSRRATLPFPEKLTVMGAIVLSGLTGRGVRP